MGWIATDGPKAYQMVEERVTILVRARGWARAGEEGPLVRAATEGMKLPDMIRLTESWGALEAAVHRPREDPEEEDLVATEDARSQAMHGPDRL